MNSNSIRKSSKTFWGVLNSLNKWSWKSERLNCDSALRSKQRDWRERAPVIEIYLNDWIESTCRYSKFALKTHERDFRAFYNEERDFEIKI